MDANVTLENETRRIILRVVPEDTMSVSLLLSRDTLKSFVYGLTKSLEYNKVAEIFSINTVHASLIDSIQINCDMLSSDIDKFRIIFRDFYVLPERPQDRFSS